MLWHDLALKGEAPPMHIPVHGNSMRPLIRSETDKVTVVPFSRPVRAYDIALFKTDETPARYLLHRVWKIEKGRVLTLGDGCLSPDKWVPAENMLGLAALIERGKHAIDPNAFFWRTYGRVWIALLPLRKALDWMARIPGRALRKIKRMMTKGIP
jgi:hypothetical protein